MEKWEIRPPLPQKPLNRSSPKFAWVIMSGTPTPMQNFITIRLPSFAPQICENGHQVTRLVFFWFFRQPTAKTPAPIFTINTSYDADSRKDVPFGGPDTFTTFTFRPNFPPKTQIFRQFSTGQFRVKKALAMGMLPCKLPLIVIVAQ